MARVLTEIIYLARNDDTGEVLCVVADSGHGYDWRFYIGSGCQPLRQVPITGRIVRLRDGGTTFFATSEGRFHAPKPDRAAGKTSPDWVRYNNERFTAITGTAEVTVGGLELRLAAV